MKFSEMQYVRPSFSVVTEKIEILLESMRYASNYEDFREGITKIEIIRRDFLGNLELAFIRNSIDVSDEFYTIEKEIADNVLPQFQELEKQYFDVLLQSSFENEINAEFGKHLLMLLRCKSETISPAIIEDLQKENKLIGEYNELKAKAEIEFKCEKYNLVELEKFDIHDDRNLRREAKDVFYQWYASHNEKLDSIFDELVKLRHNMALKLGYKNYIELAYKNRLRLDFNENDATNFHNAIIKHIVPVVVQFKKAQAKRIGLEYLDYFDLAYQFNDGNPTPKGDHEFMSDKTAEICKELSPELSKFFEFMRSNELMDLNAKANKMPGGYCTVLLQHNAPFIFSNNNGTADDVYVLTHELGHAYQQYCSMNYPIREYVFPSAESAEIHSMSLELLLLPWAEKYFKEEANKFRYSHLLSTISALAYTACGDHFQHWVYENPFCTPQERNEKWLELEKLYMPVPYNNSSEYLKGGRRWQRQMHFYEAPFYFIDYGLAQICAHQLWLESKVDMKSAWSKYETLCKIGGSKSFLNLLKGADLKSPFEEETVKEISEVVKAYLEEINFKIIAEV
jgi:M3 family oligoendopeptidase